MILFEKMRTGNIEVIGDTEENLNLEGTWQDDRVELYGRWVIPFEDILEKGLEAALLEERGRRAGGITFDHECPDKFSSAKECLLSYADEAKEITEEELPLVPPGVYFVA